MVRGPDAEFRGRLDTVLREELVDVDDFEGRGVIVLERGAATGAHREHGINAPGSEGLDVMSL